MCNFILVYVSNSFNIVGRSHLTSSYFSVFFCYDFYLIVFLLPLSFPWSHVLLLPTPLMLLLEYCISYLVPILVTLLLTFHMLCNPVVSFLVLGFLSQLDTIFIWSFTILIILSSFSVSSTFWMYIVSWKLYFEANLYSSCMNMLQQSRSCMLFFSLYYYHNSSTLVL